MPTSPSRFVAFLEQYHPVSAGLRLFLLENIKPVQMPFGKPIVEKGRPIEHLYFVSRGLVRGYAIHEGEEITTWLAAGNSLIHAISSMTGPVNSLQHVQAIKPTTLLVLPFPVLDEAYRNFPELNMIMRLILLRYYAESDCRSLIARIPNAKQRYEFFQSNFTRLNDIVPLKYIASFIGIQQATLSRIRNSQKKQPAK